MASSVIRAVMLIQLEEHQDGHARARARRSYGAVLDGVSSNQDDSLGSENLQRDI